MLEIFEQNSDGKSWMYVRTNGSAERPSFQQLGQMITGVLRCEVRNYGGDPFNDADWVRLTGLPRGYFIDAMRYPVLRHEALKRKYRLPR
jgi:hypothetical protein